MRLDHSWIVNLALALLSYAVQSLLEALPPLRSRIMSLRLHVNGCPSPRRAFDLDQWPPLRGRA